MNTDTFQKFCVKYLIHYLSSQDLMLDVRRSQLGVFCTAHGLKLDVVTRQFCTLLRLGTQRYANNSKLDENLDEEFANFAVTYLLYLIGQEGWKMNSLGHKMTGFKKRFDLSDEQKNLFALELTTQLCQLYILAPERPSSEPVA